MRLLSNSEPLSSPPPPALLSEHLPLVVFPRGAGPLAEDWAAPLRNCAERYLPRLGCILFRGFRVGERRSFLDFVSAFGEPLSPRDIVDPWDASAHDRAKTAALGVRPDEQSPALHSLHAAHGGHGPRRWLYCQRVPVRESVIVDQRDAHRRLSSGVRALLSNRGLRYVCNFGGPGETLWSEAFGTRDRTRVEAWCRASHTLFEWKASGGLRIQRAGKGLAWHPLGHERLWLDPLQFFHAAGAAGKPSRALPDHADDDAVPTNIYYGDGSPIEHEVIQQVRIALDTATSRVTWEPGDVLMLDDLVMRHHAWPRRPSLARASGWTA